MSAEFDTMSAMEMRRRIAAKEISPVELTRRALTKAEATQSTLNAFYLLMPDEALAAAKVAEDAVMKGAPLGAIHGIPFSAKDLMTVKGVGYASGSRTMKSNVATVDAPAVERAKAAGGGGNRHSAGRVGCVGRVAHQLLAGWRQSGRKRNVALG